MRIYIIRHGKAEEHTDTGIDADRVLRKRGHKQAQWLARSLSEMPHPPQLVLSSPYMRARETAEPIWEALSQPAQYDDRLGADRSLSDAMDVVVDANGADAIALVGHNPTCARLVSVICNGLTTMPQGHRTGEMALVEVQGDELVGNGTLIDRYRMPD